MTERNDSARPSPTKREVAIAKARIAGYENDTRTFTRLLVESRVRRELLNEAWLQGRSKAENSRSKTDNNTNS